MKIIFRNTPLMWLVLAAIMTMLNQCNRPSQNSKIISTDSLQGQKDTIVEPVAAPEYAAAESHQIPLTLLIKNLTSASAPVIVSIYDPKCRFLDPDNQYLHRKFAVTSKTFKSDIKGLKFGTYAMVVFQDINLSGKFDRNFVGLPVEPYGFSNNFKPTVKAPVFDQCKFKYDERHHILSITMLR